MDAAQLRWWDGANWTQQTTPAISPQTAAPVTLAAAPDPTPTPATGQPIAPVAEEPGVYVPANSVFKLGEASEGQAYVPEWSGLPEISKEVALSGVPVQLALTSATSEPPIPVSADVFPMLRSTPETASPDPVGVPVGVPAWSMPSQPVEQPLARPIDELFPAVPPTATSMAPAPAPAPAMTVPAAEVSATPSVPVAGPVAVPVAVPVAGPVAAPEGTAAPAFGLSPSVFPTAAPPSAPPAPGPSGAVFPGLVPSESAVAPAPAYAGPVVSQPVYVEPAAPQPAAPQPVSAEPAAPAPVEYQPFAQSTPGVGYEPLTPRPLPQPVNLGAPPIAAGPSAAVLAQPSVTPTAPPTEYWPTQGASYQPSPGAYVPFDPNAARVQPVPVIPFSSRDPYNPASTARPGLRSYASAPIGPSGSTYTGGLWLIVLAPLLDVAALFAATQLSLSGGNDLVNIGLPAALTVILLLSLAAAQFDRNALARRGYFDLASPFWILLLPPLVYLIIRATRLHGQGKGGVMGIVLWVLGSVAATVALFPILVSFLSAVTPDRVASVESTISQQFAGQGVTAKVDCPTIPSFAPGTVFNCTATAGTKTALVQVTVTNWQGVVSDRVISTTDAAQQPATPSS